MSSVRMTFDSSFLLLFKELYTAPINENPQAILDLGTGTGIWAIDMAELAKTLSTLINEQQIPFSTCHR